MAAILKKKWWLGIKFRLPSCLPHQYTSTPRYQFSLKSNKVEIFAIWRPFWKTMVARNKISMVPSCLPHQYTPRYQFSLKSDKVEIFYDMAAFLKKKWWLGTKFRWYHHFRHINILQRYQFSLKSDKVDIFAKWQPFWKKKWWFGK